MTIQVAILVEEGFHDIEFWYPYFRLIEEGYCPLIVAPLAPRQYGGKYGTHADATYAASSLTPQEVRGIVIPGGWAPDRLRTHRSVVNLVKSIYEEGGIVAGICHAGSLLISAEILRGKRATSYQSIRDDMILAGAEWIDAAVVISDRLITSRSPNDLPFFARALIEQLDKM